MNSIQITPSFLTALYVVCSANAQNVSESSRLLVGISKQLWNHREQQSKIPATTMYYPNVGVLLAISR